MKSFSKFLEESKLEELKARYEVELDDLQQEIEKLEDSGSAVPKKLLYRRKTLQTQIKGCERHK